MDDNIKYSNVGKKYDLSFQTNEIKREFFYFIYYHAMSINCTARIFKMYPLTLFRSYCQLQNSTGEHDLW